MMEFELRSKNATASLGDMASSREVASLQEKVRQLSSKLAEFDVRKCVVQLTRSMCLHHHYL